MLKQKKTWILLADGENARLIEQESPHSQLRQICHFHSHPLSSQQDVLSAVEIPFLSTRFTCEAHPTESHKQRFQFAHDLIGYIKTANDKHRFDELYVFAPPSILGYIRQGVKHANKNLKNVIKKFFNKDLIHLDLLKLKDYFAKVS